ncbi:MAG: response regulator [Alphaproteobacteria bacterium]|nr:response regulator [Alphaproteobacteria bacterium]
MGTAAKRLLAIDDEPAIREIIRSTAAGLDYDTCVTERANAFKEAYAAFDPTVIVLDIVMPETDGIELMRWLVDRGTKAKIIVASGYNELYAKMAAKLGSDSGLSVAFLDKPFRVEALRDMLRATEA